jgi:hypothetical protein
MNKLMKIVLSTAALVSAAGAAQAGNVHWSVGINLPPVATVISSGPVYGPVYGPAYVPAPVYAPAPVYVPPPVVYRPAPVVYPAPVYYGPRYYGPPAVVVERAWGPPHRHWDRGYDNRGYDRGYDGRGDWRGHDRRHHDGYGR